ncbi:glycine zipper 2TM domain-containing protein, partial [Inhella proteolytica]
PAQPAAQATPPAARSARPPAVPPQAAAAQVAPACRDCGVVESVEKRVRSAPTSGVGAVAGGVVGGLLGNQFGKGDGRRAMTVVGAVGGGVLGHEIEKKQRSHTEYLVRVRMADGSLRERVQARPLAIGSHVRLGEQGLQLLETAP